ncbi:hypothetical protein V2J09_011865, partial [Rumex salicifolius]
EKDKKIFRINGISIRVTKKPNFFPHRPSEDLCLFHLQKKTLIYLPSYENRRKRRNPVCEDSKWDNWKRNFHKKRKKKRGKKLEYFTTL